MFILCISIILLLTTCNSVPDTINTSDKEDTSWISVQQTSDPSLKTSGQDTPWNTETGKSSSSTGDTQKNGAASGDTNTEAEITVTEEVYRDTFKKIENLILELNATIQKGDYTTWLTYLTDDYKNRYGDEKMLKTLSESPTLKDNSIRLRTLRDYFEKVVMPSRIRVVLDRLVFINERHIRAIAVFQETSLILYTLKQENGIWKIATE